MDLSSMPFVTTRFFTLDGVILIVLKTALTLCPLQIKLKKHLVAKGEVAAGRDGEV